MYKQQPFKTEKELAKAMIAYLIKEGYEVWQEVQFNYGIHDIVAVKDNKLTIVECKLTCSVAVIEQAVRAKRNAHFTYVCVPMPAKERHVGFKETIIRKFNCGLFLVSQYNHNDIISSEIHTASNPKKEETKFPKMLNKNLEYLKEVPKTFCEAGGKGGGYYTPYKATMKIVKQIITDFPGITLSSLISELGDQHHYASKQSARASIRKALGSFETNWCEIIITNNKNDTYKCKDTS